MGMHDSITAKQADLIRNSKIFFVASVHPQLTNGPAGEGAVNVSPKGMTPVHILSDNLVVYLDYPGSGNETSRHVNENGPVTLMFLSTEPENAAIVRLYGHARSMPVEQSAHAKRILADAPNPEKARQAFEIVVDKTQTSCGYGVPVFDFLGERPRSGRGRRYKD